MLRPFLTALTQKILNFLQENPEFFQGKADEKKKLLEKLKVPAPIAQYLEKADAEQFLKELQNMVNYLEYPRETMIGDNQLLKAVNHFFTKDLAAKIDHLDGDFYLMSKDSREKIVAKLINSETLVAQQLKALLLNFSYQQVSAELKNFSASINESPYILVQTPKEMNVEMKRKIRESVHKKDENSFPIFQVNKKTIGGLRIFRNGVLTDYSWRNRVHQLINATQ